MLQHRLSELNQILINISISHLNFSIPSDLVLSIHKAKHPTIDRQCAQLMLPSLGLEGFGWERGNPHSDAYRPPNPSPQKLLQTVA